MASITLGGKAIEFGILNIGQLRKLGIGLAGAGDVPETFTKAQKETAAWDSMIDAISTATGMSTEQILALEGATVKEVSSAANAIYRAAGIVVAVPGEAAAGA